MPQGGNVTLSASNRTLDPVEAARIEHGRLGRFLRFEVRDTGTGIPAEHLERIWDPFFTTKGEDKGTGLGLSTVRGIVTQHGGFITLWTREGEGSAFAVYLPASEETAGAEQMPKVAPQVRGKGELILVVDDEAPVREFIAGALIAHGYRAITACDGAEAIAVFTPCASEVRLLITDVQMPLLDGRKLALALRRMRLRLPVIQMSGVECDDDAPRNGENTRCIAKPFNMETLLALVHDGLGDQPKEAPVRSV